MRLRQEQRAEPRRSGSQPPADRRSRRRTDRWTVIVAIVAVLGLLGAAVVAGVSTRDVVAPMPVTESKLGHLACLSPDRCVAVGSTGSRYTIRHPYSVRSVGGSWAAAAPVSTIENGDSFLDSISCPSQAVCVAVGRQEVPAPYFGAKSGGDRQLVETWNGRQWRVVRSPIPPRTTDAHLSGVDCVGSTCMAVGGYDRKGATERVLTQVWNGSRWTLVLPPKPRQMQEPTLSSVSCVSATSCFAVGQFNYELGFGEIVTPLILRWNGKEWWFEPSGKLGDALDTTLGAVSCPSRELCVAVGTQRRGRATFSTFAEIRRGESWLVSPTREPDRSRYANLVDVACASDRRCIAVGYSVVGGAPSSLVEWWNGSRWTIGSAPTVDGATATALSGVTCPTASRCVVVGNYRGDTPAEHGFTSRWDGDGWATTLAPDPVAGTSQSPSPS